MNRVLKLFHLTKMLGIITEPFQDGLGMGGTVYLTEEANSYKEIFSYIVDQEKMESGQDPPFDASYFFDNWFIEEEDGTRKESIIPGIHEEHDIYWRYC